MCGATTTIDRSKIFFKINKSSDKWIVSDTWTVSDEWIASARDAETREGGREETRAVVRRRAREFCFVRIVIVSCRRRIVSSSSSSRSRNGEDAKTRVKKSASGDSRARRRRRSRSRSRDRAFVARESHARIARLDERVRARRERIARLEIVRFFTPPPRVPRRRLRRESSVDARDQKILPKTVIPTPVRRLSPRPTTRRSRGRTPRNPSRRRGARARASSRSRLRLATSPATPRRRFYSPPRRRDTPSRVFPSTTPTRRVSSRSDVRFARTKRAKSQSSRERERHEPSRDETRRDETNESNDAPRSRVLRRRRRRTRRRRNTAPARRARFHPSVAPSRTYEPTNTNASVARAHAFDSRRHRGIESNLDDGVMMSRAVRMASTRARERKKGASRSRGRSRVRSVARVDDASSCMHARMHSRARVVEDVCLVPDVYRGMSPRVRSICPSRVR